MINKNTTFLIVGLGLLGGSYAMVLKQKGYKVLGIARRQETIDYALAHNIIDEGSIDVSQLVSKADVIILGLYPKMMISWIQEHQHLFQYNTMITDVGGVKLGIVDEIHSSLRKDAEFISAHPMAGKETSGIEYANVEMFQKANYIITPTEKNSKDAISFSYDLANLLGFARISELSCEEHDRMIAFLSQLTHVIAVSLMNTHDNEHLVQYTGDSFRDLTRIAKINENMWSELFLENKDILLEEIDHFIASISNFRDALATENTNEMKKLFIQSTDRRKKFDI